MSESESEKSVEHTVLLVDDEEILLHALVRALRQQPYRLYTARSGKEALAVLKARPVDLVVSDEQMPGMCGSELMAWIAEHYPDVIRIILTGQATTDGTIRAINEGSVLHFFTKPCDMVHLAISIRKALEHKDLVGNHRRLLERNSRQEQQFQQFEHDLESLSRLVAESLREPLERICQATASPAAAAVTGLGGEAQALLETATAAAAQSRRVCSAELTACRGG